MIRTRHALVVLALLVPLALPMRAQAFSCATANVQWGGSVLGGVGPSGPKHLYFLLTCGLNPDAVARLAREGTGEVFKLPEKVATEADEITPVMHRVDYVYLRGGGPGRPIIVVPMTNGITGFFVTCPGTWTGQRAATLQAWYDRLPYPYLKTGSSQFEDLVICNGSVPLGGFWGLIQGGTAGGLSMPTGYQALSGNAVDEAGIANDGSGGCDPDYGTLCSESWGATTPVHELAHMNQFAREWIVPALFVMPGSFGSISWHNAHVLFIPIPLVFQHNLGSTGTHAFVSKYAMHPFGHDGPMEDYAETVTAGVLASFDMRPRNTSDADEAASREQIQKAYNWRGFDPPLKMTPDTLHGFHRLFLEKDPVMKAKARAITGLYTYSGCDPQDADGDGDTWSPLTGGDCDDSNPAVAGDCPPIDPDAASLPICACPAGQLRNDKGVCVKVDTVDASVFDFAAQDASGKTTELSAGATACLDVPAQGVVPPGATKVGAEGDCTAWRFGASGSGGGGGGSTAKTDLGTVAFQTALAGQVGLAPASGGCYQAVLPQGQRAFRPGAKVTVSATGGHDFPAFSQQVAGPIDLGLRVGIFTPGRALELAFSGGQAPTLVALSAGGSSGVVTIQCQAKAGATALKVPGTLTAKLDGAASGVSLSVARSRTVTGRTADGHHLVSLSATRGVSRQLP